MNNSTLIRRAIKRYRKEVGHGEPLFDICEREGNYIWLYDHDAELLQIYSGADHNYLRIARQSTKGVKERGWTDHMISRLLGEPDAEAPNPHYKTASPTRLYDLIRVQRAEETEEFAQLLAEAERRRRQPDPLKPTTENLAKAIWEVNKEAKRRRDAARAMYNDGRYGLASSRSQQKKEAYALKELALKKAAQKGIAQIDTYHRIGDGVFVCWQIDGVRFHEPMNADEVPDSVTVVPLPEGWESEAAPVGTRMALGVAKVTLREWLNIGGESVDLVLSRMRRERGAADGASGAG